MGRVRRQVARAVQEGHRACPLALHVVAEKRRAAVCGAQRQHEIVIPDTRYSEYGYRVEWQRRSGQVWQCLLAGAAMAAEAHGEVIDTQPVIYGAEFFAPFAPQTALDMVERVPGFSIDEGQDRRGFAGAQGNVLIDGEPPTAKSQEIDDLLARIPASDVVRIELIRSSSAGSGQAVRVNVVRRVGGGAGVWTLGFAHAEDGRISPSGDAAYSGRRGDMAVGGAGCGAFADPGRTLRLRRCGCAR